MQWKPKPFWKRWFAWYPVYTYGKASDGSDDVVVWLSWVERRNYVGIGMVYRQGKPTVTEDENG